MPCSWFRPLFIIQPIIGAYECGLVLFPEEWSCPAVADSACIDAVPVTTFKDIGKHLPGRPHSGEAASIDRMLERLGEELSASHSARAADQQDLKLAREKLNTLEQDNARLEFRCASLFDQLLKSECLAEDIAKAHEALDAQDRVIASLEAEIGRSSGRFSSRLAAFTRFCGYRLSRHGLLWPSYARLAASGLFDRKFYLEQNLDVAKAGHNPLLHFLLHGAGEGRDPSPLFDLSWYLAAYPDVAAAKINPLLHYYMHGAAEGRRPRPPLMGQRRCLEIRGMPVIERFGSARRPRF
jgi:hypothetical protein